MIAHIIGHLFSFLFQTIIPVGFNCVRAVVTIQLLIMAPVMFLGAILSAPIHHRPSSSYSPTPYTTTSPNFTLSLPAPTSQTWRTSNE